MKRVLVYGISGATWSRIDPLLAAGRLPTLKRLIDTGCRATLQSARADGDKHYRPQGAWPSVATGCEPAGHGVTRFYHRADDVARPAIWDAFLEAGHKVGLFHWPITWPPPPVNGFVVPGYDGRDPATWPAELSVLRSLDARQDQARGGSDAIGRLRVGRSVAVLKTLLAHGVGPASLLKLAATAASSKLGMPAELRPLRMRAARLDVNTDLFVRLFRRHQPAFAGFVTFLVDYASHRYWMFGTDASENAPPSLRDAVDRAYIDVDRSLGRLVNRVGGGAVVAVVSEHGMAAEPDSAEIGPSHWVLRPNALRSFVGLDPTTVAAPVARWIAFRPPAEQLADVANRFETVTIDGTGYPLFQVYTHRDEVIVKLALTRQIWSAPTLDALHARFGKTVVPFTSIAQVFGRRRSAMHAAEAVLVLNGPGIRRGATVEGARVIDVAPTLLEAAGLAVPAMDGKALDVFAAR